MGIDERASGRVAAISSGTAPGAEGTAPGPEGTTPGPEGTTPGAEGTAPEGTGAPAGSPQHVAAGSALRERALASAVAVYTAAHGHPLEHPEPGTAQVRWGTGTRVAVAATVVLALLTTVVVGQVLLAAPAPVHTARDPSRAPAVQAGATHSPGTPGSGPGREASGSPTSVPARALDGATGTAPAQALAGVTGTAPAQALGGATGTAPVLVVHVVGEVHAPGLVRLPSGARVQDAVTAAGGPTAGADLAAVNLARPLVDGEQLRVPAPGETASPAPAPAPAAPDAAAPVDLNTASVDALDDLPGIGPVLAQRVVQWRTEHGRFTSVEELAEVTGIGPAVLAAVRERVRVG